MSDICFGGGRNMKYQKIMCNVKLIPDKIPLIFMVFIGLLGLTSVVLGDSWATKADMLNPMSNLSTMVINGKIYAIGGSGGQARVGQQITISEIEEYDPAQNIWTEKAKIPSERINSSISTVNGKIYVIGGYDDNGLISEVDEYSPTTDTWAKKANILTQRTGLSTCVVNGKIYAIGGEKLAGGALSTVEEYNPVTNKWTKKADMLATGTALSTCVVNGKIYIVGRTNIQPAVGGGQTTVEEYNPDNDTWKQKADIPTPMNNPFVTVIDAKIYVIGESWNRAAGGGIVQGGNVQTVMQYDPAIDTWTQKADIPTQQNNSSIAVADGKIYVIGGSGDLAGVGGPAQAGNVQTVEQYDPTTDIWTQKTDIPTQRSNSSVAVVNGKIYVIGGLGTQQAGAVGVGQMSVLKTVEEYTPDGWQSFSVSAAGKLVTKWGAIKIQN
jgi:N-acetylneuraminic acid mutarotase